MAPDDNTVAAVERRRENNGSGWRSSLPPLKDDRFKQPERRERAPATSGKTPEVVTDKVAGQSARTPPAAQPPSEPAVDADANAPDTAAMPDAHGCRASPRRLTCRTTRPPICRRRSNRPSRRASHGTRPRIRPRKIAASLAEEFYSAFAHLGETLAFMTPGRSERQGSRGRRERSADVARATTQ